MRKTFTCITLALLLIHSGALQAQEPRLTYELRPGESYVLEIDLQQSTHSESIDSEEISFYSMTSMVFRIDSTDAHNNYHMSVQYNDLLISMLAPQLDIDISSSSGKNLMLTALVDLLEKETFYLMMSPAGELKNLEGLDALFNTLESQPAADTMEQGVILNTLKEAYGPHAFSSLFNLFVWIYPVISPMSNWTNDLTYYFNTKPVKVVNRYYLSKTTDDMLVIQGLGMLNATKEFHETTDMGEVKSTVSGSQTYDFQVDRESGWLKRCVSRQRVMIETTILKSNYFPPGLKIPSYTETSFEVKGRRMQ
ncbi:MAG: hypothetical protein KAR16_00680 [Bacteroidales bacterium]|nr:hypothetical protein [Bacteroidales bacterium]